MVLQIADDFGEMDQRVEDREIETPAKKKARRTEDQPREWLKVWETAPAKMLNAQGQAKYANMSLSQVWKEL